MTTTYSDRNESAKSFTLVELLVVIATWYGARQSPCRILGSDIETDIGGNGFYGYRGQGPLQPRRASLPAILPMLFDEAAVPGWEGHYRNHRDNSINPLYFDCSVTPQAADKERYGHYVGKKDPGTQPNWHFPCVRKSPFPR